jgi:hypothetical protein
MTGLQTMYAPIVMLVAAPQTNVWQAIAFWQESDTPLLAPSDRVLTTPGTSSAKTSKPTPKPPSYSCAPR